ncbi:MAG: hypothetical protein ACPGFC_03030, partial [Paracoccaceae bacterium]
LVGDDQAIQVKIETTAGVEVIAWADLATSSGGTWSGNVTISPTDAELRAVYRFKDFTATEWNGGAWRAGLQGL